MLASEGAVVAYQEQRLKLEAAHNVRDDLKQADLADTQPCGNDEIA
jgi:hypothetical protein